MHRAHAGRTDIVNSEWSDIVVKGPAHHIVSIEDAPVVPGLVSSQYDEETPYAKRPVPRTGLHRFPPSRYALRPGRLSSMFIITRV